MLFAVLSGFVLAAFAPWIYRLLRGAAGWVLALLPLALLLYFFRLAAQAVHGQPAAEQYAWAPSLGLALSFHGDGLGLLFAMLISGIGALVVVYSGGYLKDNPLLGRWYCFLLVFMASMLGVVLADNLIALFVFWELTSFSSYLLIGFNSHEEKSRDAALQALLVTGLGGLAMLAGFVLLGIAGGSYDISALVAAGGESVRESSLYSAILALVLAGALTKSAQFPFHFWLPNAMVAPAPASAYLHSSTMVKAGLYLLARLSPVLGGTPAWTFWVTAFGAATMFLGACLALQQHVLKRLMAYSTVSALGAVTMLLGLGFESAAQAAVAFVLAHALYKGALFLVAGAIDHGTGERDVRRLGALARAMPVTAAAAAVAALSMSGIPLMFGFVAKEMLYASAMRAHGLAAPLLTVLSVVSSMCFLVVALCVAWRPFHGPQVETSKHPHEAPPSMWLGPAVLGAGTLALGLFPPLAGPLLGAAANGVLGAHGETHLHLALWHGFTPALGLSVITVCGGVLAYLYRDRLIAAAAPLQTLVRYGPERGYNGAMQTMTWTAELQTRILQNGYLRYYLLLILAMLLLVPGSVLLLQTEAVSQAMVRHVLESVEHLRFYELGLAAVITIAIGAAVHSRTRLAAVAALGVVGYGIALIFVLFGAPDLAMTQFVIETLTVILFVLVFYHLPPFAFYASKPAIVRDLVIAGGVGVLMALLVLVASDVTGPPGISQYFREHSYDLAHGRNVVNVILVDFRAIDTLGEITVLSVAGVGAYALLKLRPNRRAGK